MWASPSGPPGTQRGRYTVCRRRDTDLATRLGMCRLPSNEWIRLNSQSQSARVRQRCIRRIQAISAWPMYCMIDSPSLQATGHFISPFSAHHHTSGDLPLWHSSNRLTPNIPGCARRAHLAISGLEYPSPAWLRGLAIQLHTAVGLLLQVEVVLRIDMDGGICLRTGLLFLAVWLAPTA